MDEAKSSKNTGYYRSGGTTMIDAQPWCAGRDIQALAV
jgi:predicted metal-dependent phosphotriesterase family hydrolase